MSTATIFQNREGFLPYVLIGDPSGGVGHDYVDVTPDKAVALYWALENFEVVTTCTATPASINWTTTFGATESIPFTAGGGGGTNTRAGAYYDGVTPASAPNGRIKSGTTAPLIQSLITNIGGGPSEQKQIEMRVFVRESPTAGMMRVWYRFRFRNFYPPMDAIVMNPSNTITKTGTPPSSGTFDVLGVTFSWIGGGSTSGSPSIWGIQTATVSATSSAFTF